MQIRDLLILILRIFGIYILLFFSFPILISNMKFYVGVFSDWDTDVIGYVTSTIILPIAMALLLIFGSSMLINLFKLDKGFQSSEVLLNKTSQLNLVKLAIILLGGFLIINNLVNTISYIVETFRQSLYGMQDNDYFNFWKSGLSVFFGALLITNREAIAKWLMPKQLPEEN